MHSVPPRGLERRDFIKVMEKERIEPSLERLLFGQTPPEFMLEVAARSVFVLAAFAIAGRLLGKRMNGQLTVVEFAVMVSLGAIIAPAIQLPERGVLMAVAALICTLLFQRGLTRLDFQSPAFEKFSQGQGETIIKDGVMQLGSLRGNRLSKQQILALLRHQGVTTLGEVARLYLEACGSFSLYRCHESRPGLSVIPPSDRRMRQAEARGGREICCSACGLTTRGHKGPERCAECGGSTWEAACQPARHHEA